MEDVFNLIGHDNWRNPIHWEEPIGSKFKVLRPIYFFCQEQIVTIEELEKFFTNKAIIAFLNDKFIEKLND